MVETKENYFKSTQSIALLIGSKSGDKLPVGKDIKNMVQVCKFLCFTKIITAFTKKKAEYVLT
jgi:hypothetical protein